MRASGSSLHKELKLPPWLLGFMTGKGVSPARTLPWDTRVHGCAWLGHVCHGWDMCVHGWDTSAMALQGPDTHVHGCVWPEHVCEWLCMAGTCVCMALHGQNTHVHGCPWPEHMCAWLYMAGTHVCISGTHVCTAVRCRDTCQGRCVPSATPLQGLGAASELIPAPPPQLL